MKWVCKIWVFGCFSVVLLIGPAVLRGQTLELRTSTIVEGPDVLLGDLLLAENDVPAGWLDRLIAEAPVPGQSKEVLLGDVARALHAYPDMHNVVLRGNPSIHVTVQVETLDTLQLESAIAAFAEQQDALSGQRFRVDSQVHTLPSVPSGDAWSPEILAIDADHDGYFARLRFVSSDGSYTPETGSYRIALDELFPYWQVSHPVSRGESLTEGDLTTRWLPQKEATRFYPAEENIAGMEVRRNLRGGQMISQGSLAEPMFARRGEVVRVLLQRGGLSITLRARAMADGRRDERIPCLNERSGRRLYVRMVSPREAILEGGQGADS